MPVCDALRALLFNRAARGAPQLTQRAAASGDVMQRRVFQEPELFSDMRFCGAQFAGVALFAVDLILWEVEVSR